MPSSACSGQCCPGRSGRGAGAARAPSSPLAASAAPWSQQGPSSASAGDQGGLGRGRGHRRLRGGSGRSDASQPRSGPPSHSPRRAASRTRHGLTARPVKRTCQGVGTGVRWVDRGTGAAGPAWLVVREPRGRPAEAIPRTTRPRSRTRRPRALFWVGGSFLNKVPLTKNSDQETGQSRSTAAQLRTASRLADAGVTGTRALRRAQWTQAACCAAHALLASEGVQDTRAVRWPVLGLLVHMWLARRTVYQQFSALLRFLS